MKSLFLEIKWYPKNVLIVISALLFQNYYPVKYTSVCRTRDRQFWFYLFKTYAQTCNALVDVSWCWVDLILVVQCHYNNLIFAYFLKPVLLNAMVVSKQFKDTSLRFLVIQLRQFFRILNQNQLVSPFSILNLVFIMI